MMMHFLERVEKNHADSLMAISIACTAESSVPVTQSALWGMVKNEDYPNTEIVTFFFPMNADHAKAIGLLLADPILQSRSAYQVNRFCLNLTDPTVAQQFQNVVKNPGYSDSLVDKSMLRCTKKNGVLTL